MPQHEIPEDEIPIEVSYWTEHPFSMVPKWITALVGDGSISFGAHFLFVVLLGYAERSRGSVYPNKKTLTAAVGRSKRAVDGYMAELEAVGAVYVQRRPQDDGRHKSNRYHLAVSSPIPPAERSRRPVDNSAVEDARGRVQDSAPSGNTGNTAGQGAADCTHQGAADCTRTRITKEQEQEMPIRAAARPRAEAEPVENPPLTKRDRDATAEDFEAWWTAYRFASDRQPGAKRPAQRAYALARREHGAAELRALLDGYAAGHARQRMAGFVAAFPDAVRWLRDERWQDYALSGAQGGADGSGASEPSAGAVARVEALRGPYSPPELPAELSPEDYRARVVADRADWLTGGGRWENVTA